MQSEDDKEGRKDEASFSGACRHTICALTLSTNEDIEIDRAYGSNEVLTALTLKTNMRVAVMVVVLMMLMVMVLVGMLVVVTDSQILTSVRPADQRKVGTRK